MITTIPISNQKLSNDTSITHTDHVLDQSHIFGNHELMENKAYSVPKHFSSDALKFMSTILHSSSARKLSLRKNNQQRNLNTNQNLFKKLALEYENTKDNSNASVDNVVLLLRALLLSKQDSQSSQFAVQHGIIDILMTLANQSSPEIIRLSEALIGLLVVESEECRLRVVHCGGITHFGFKLHKLTSCRLKVLACSRLSDLLFSKSSYPPNNLLPPKPQHSRRRNLQSHKVCDRTALKTLHNGRTIHSAPQFLFHGNVRKETTTVFKLRCVNCDDLQSQIPCRHAMIRALLSGVTSILCDAIVDTKLTTNAINAEDTNDQLLLQNAQRCTARIAIFLQQTCASKASLDFLCYSIDREEMSTTQKPTAVFSPRFNVAVSVARLPWYVSDGIDGNVNNSISQFMEKPTISKSQICCASSIPEHMVQVTDDHINQVSSERITRLIKVTLTIPTLIGALHLSPTVEGVVEQKKLAAFSLYTILHRINGIPPALDSFMEIQSGVDYKKVMRKHIPSWFNKKSSADICFSFGKTATGTFDSTKMDNQNISEPNSVSVQCNKTLEVLNESKPHHHCINLSDNAYSRYCADEEKDAPLYAHSWVLNSCQVSKRVFQKFLASEYNPNNKNGLRRPLHGSTTPPSSPHATIEQQPSRREQLRERMKNGGSMFKKNRTTKDKRVFQRRKISERVIDMSTSALSRQLIKDVLYCIYTQNVEDVVNRENALDLLAVAIKCGFSLLRKHCQYVIAQTLSFDNIVNVYDFAIEFQINVLIDHCANFIVRNLGTLFQSNPKLFTDSKYLAVWSEVSEHLQMIFGV